MVWLWILIGIIIAFVVTFIICAIIMGKAVETYYHGIDNEERYENDIPKEKEIKKEE